MKKKTTVTPVHTGGPTGYFCGVEHHRSDLDRECHFCKASPVTRHMFTKESNSEDSGRPRTPLCQQHYEEWAAYLGLHELVVGHD